MNEKSNELIMGFDSVTLNTYQRNRTWQQIEEYSGNSGLNSKGYALNVKNRPISFYNSAFVGDEFSTQTGYLIDYTVGISSNNNLILDLSRIRGMDYGTRIRANLLELDFSDNIISKNLYGVYLEEDVQADLTMGCTQFIKYSNSNPTQYGIYVESGASILGDIGGQFPNLGLPPAGNGLPVDPGSTGSQQSPPTTFGTNGVDVYNWSWPENWYSIYDANAISETDTQSYFYWRYSNEFFGEAEFQADWGTDAIYPSALKANSGIQESSSYPCANVPGIRYPLSRIAGINEYEDGFIKFYPNPTERELRFLSESDENHKNLYVQIVDMKGNTVLEMDNLGIEDALDISVLRAGTYVVIITDMHSGESSESKILIK